MDVIYLKDFADLFKTIDSINSYSNAICGSSYGEMIHFDLSEFDIHATINYESDNVVFYCFDNNNKDKIYILTILIDYLLNEIYYLNKSIESPKSSKNLSSIKHNKVGFL
jgi:hypothetical protein